MNPLLLDLVIQGCKLLTVTAITFLAGWNMVKENWAKANACWLMVISICLMESVQHLAVIAKHYK